MMYTATHTLLKKYLLHRTGLVEVMIRQQGMAWVEQAVERCVIDEPMLWMSGAFWRWYRRHFELVCERMVYRLIEEGVDADALELWERQLIKIELVEELERYTERLRPPTVVMEVINDELRIKN